jgi:hypothetical protein
MIRQPCILQETQPWPQMLNKPLCYHHSLNDNAKLEVDYSTFSIFIHIFRVLNVVCKTLKTEC